MDDKIFEKKNLDKINLMSKDKQLKEKSTDWMIHSSNYEYSYHFKWLGRPIIQIPQDIIAIQEIIWKVKPDLIIETGVARGGSIIFSASILELIGNGNVVGIDIDIRKHNKSEIEKHPMFKRIILVEGSSISKKTISEVYKLSKNKKKILVFLDSNHTHNHVLKEMEFYSPLIKKGCYMVVFDTNAESFPSIFFKNRPWGKGNNAMTAVIEFLSKNNRFKIDKNFENKLLITSNPSGYLKCIKN